MELSITSVDQSPIEMGRIAAKVFLEEVDSDTPNQKNEKIVLQPELIIRDSSLKVKA